MRVEKVIKMNKCSSRHTINVQEMLALMVTLEGEVGGIISVFILDLWPLTQRPLIRPLPPPRISSTIR